MKKKICLGFVAVLALAFLGCDSDSNPSNTESDSSSSQNVSSSSFIAQDSSVMDYENYTLTDLRDGQVYKTVYIAGHTWMAENLNFKTDSGSVCYSNEESNCATYGRLYTWDAAMNACPKGWRLPDNDEWSDLYDYAKINSYGSIGSSLMSTSLWDLRNDAAQGTDDFGFNALPAGYLHDNGQFYNLTGCTFFWSSTEFGGDAYDRHLYAGEETFNSSYGNKSRGYSVRCVHEAI